MHQAIKLLKKIPKGKVVTYGELARVCDTSPRAIGRIMASNTAPASYPCYKVVAFDGKLCGYSAKEGLKTKEKLLQEEGIEIKNGKVDSSFFYLFPK